MSLEMDDNDWNKPEVSVRRYLLRLLKRWPYILIFFVSSVAAGYLFNRYLTPIYAITGRITTKKFSNQSNTPVPGLVDASFFLNGLTEVYEEIPTLKSYQRMAATIDKVDFSVSYYAQGFVKTVESVHGYGFDVEIDTLLGGSYPHSVPIFVNHISKERFQLHIEDEGWEESTKGKTYTFGVPFTIGDASLRVINTNGSTAEKDKYFFVLNRKEDLINKYRNRLAIDWVMKGSSMLDLYMESEIPEKDIEFMQAYYQVVIDMGLAEKNETLDNTIHFIDEQMEMVTDSLEYYQSLIDDMKLDNRYMATGSEPIYDRLAELDDKKAELIVNERYFDYLTDYFKTHGDAEVFAPSLDGKITAPMTQWVGEYITKKISGKEIRNDSNYLNPLLNRQDSSGKKLSKGIFEAMRSARERNRQALQEMAAQERALLQSVNTVQTGHRELTRFERLYELNYSLFELFIKRRTEAAISKASATSDYKVISDPGYARAPIKPNKKQNLIYAAAIGLLLPIGFFLFRDLTNPNIADKDDLQMTLNMPHLGNVAHNDYETKLVVLEHPRSVVTESFRAVRANLKYLVTKSNAGAQTFLVTSSIGGEGKTFCSINLGQCLSLSDKRVVVIGADLRKPELGNYIQAHRGKGLSAYLAGYATLEELVVLTADNMPTFIDAGKIPPNPAELLASERMQLLMDYLKKNFDYIIIDTPPIGLVSDAMELFKYSDYNILIVRQGVTPKAALRMINDLNDEGKLPHFTVLLNDIELVKRRYSVYSGYLYGMGYSGYGYGYYEDDKEKKKG